MGRYDYDWVNYYDGELAAREDELEEIEKGKKTIGEVLNERDELKDKVSYLEDDRDYYKKKAREVRMALKENDSSTRGGKRAARKNFVGNIGWVLQQTSEDIKEIKVLQKGKRVFAVISYWENEKHHKIFEEQKEIDITDLDFAEIFCAIATNFKKPLSRWIKLPGGGIKCPRCGAIYSNILNARNFCANCGAGMKGNEER